MGNLRSLIPVTCHSMLWIWVWPFFPSPSSSLEFSHQLLVLKISMHRQKVHWLQVEEAGHSEYSPHDLFIHNSLPHKGQNHIFIMNQPKRTTTIWKKCKQLNNNSEILKLSTLCENRLREYCVCNSGENQLSLSSNKQWCSITSASKTNQLNLLQVILLSIHYATEMIQHHELWNHNQ